MSLRASQVASDYSIEHVVKILQDHYQQMLRATEGRKPSLHQRWVAFMDGLHR